MQKPTQQLTVSTVNFLAEKDGPTERELKQALADAFAQLGSVTAAYLALVDYGRPAEQNVALCIVTDGADPAEIVAAVGRIFHSMFNGEAHLDILPLSKEEELRIALVCRPFFIRKNPVDGQ
jgi:hypothetical protein